MSYTRYYLWKQLVFFLWDFGTTYSSVQIHAEIYNLAWLSKNYKNIFSLYCTWQNYVKHFWNVAHTWWIIGTKYGGKKPPSIANITKFGPSRVKPRAGFLHIFTVAFDILLYAI